MTDFPQFVEAEGYDNSAFRLCKQGSGYTYYVDNGDWEQDFLATKDKSGKTIILGVPDGGHLSSKKFIPITEAKWRERVGHYAPTNYEKLGYLIEDNQRGTKNEYKYLLIRR